MLRGRGCSIFQNSVEPHPRNLRHIWVQSYHGGQIILNGFLRGGGGKRFLYRMGSFPQHMKTEEFHTLSLHVLLPKDIPSPLSSAGLIPAMYISGLCSFVPCGINDRAGHMQKSRRVCGSNGKMILSHQNIITVGLPRSHWGLRPRMPVMQTWEGTIYDDCSARQLS